LLGDPNPLPASGDGQTCLRGNRAGNTTRVTSATPDPARPDGDAPDEDAPDEQADPGGDSDVEPDPARSPGDPYED
jgi:hypothetical protein